MLPVCSVAMCGGAPTPRDVGYLYQVRTEGEVIKDEVEGVII